MIDYLPEAEQALLLEIVRRFVSDDVATPDDIAAISAARKEYDSGETVSHASVWG
jgi:hypothetical protein